jgi:hypothetical protein
MSWAGKELAGVELGDDRRALRLMQIVERLVERAEQSIPQGFGSWSETKAAYRFFENPQIDWPEILAPHRASTVSRAAAEPIVLVAQDTTEINLSEFPATAGLGYLASPKCRGVLLHTCLATTPAGVVLGVIDQQMWVRPVEELGKRHTRRQRTTDEKESQRLAGWLASYANRLGRSSSGGCGCRQRGGHLRPVRGAARRKCPTAGTGQSRATVCGTRGKVLGQGDSSHCGARGSVGGSAASRSAPAATGTTKRALVDAVDLSTQFASGGIAVDPFAVRAD